MVKISAEIQKTEIYEIAICTIFWPGSEKNLDPDLMVPLDPHSNPS